MNTVKALTDRFRGWLPASPKSLAAQMTVKPKWHNPKFLAATLTLIIVLCFLVYMGTSTLVRYINPAVDTPAALFTKTVNATTVHVGDTVEVTLKVYWHGKVTPEFERQVQIVDAYPKDAFKIVEGNSTVQYIGYGGANSYHYQLEVLSGAQPVQTLPKPQLFLDNAAIPLEGAEKQVELTVQK